MYGNSNYGAYPYQGAPYYNGNYSTPMYQPNNPQPSMNTNKLYATSIEDVRARQLPPNSDYIFLDNDKPLVYRKTTDATGKMDIQVFEIKPYQPEKSTPAPSVDLSKFVLKRDFEALKTEIEQLRDSIKTEAPKVTNKKTL